MMKMLLKKIKRLPYGRTAILVVALVLCFGIIGSAAALSSSVDESGFFNSIKYMLAGKDANTIANNDLNLDLMTEEEYAEYITKTDDIAYGSASNGAKIQIATNNTESNGSNITETEYENGNVEETGYAPGTSLGSATAIEDMEYNLKNSIMKEVTDHFGTVLEGATGKDGKDGAPGATGPAGKTGATGATGKTGAPGKTGAAGKDGKDGKDGIDGVDGKNGLNTYVVYSQYANGKNGDQNSYTTTPNMHTKYMGIASAETKPTSADGFTWTQYKELTLEYVNTGTPTLYIRK